MLPVVGATGPAAAVEAMAATDELMDANGSGGGVVSEEQNREVSSDLGEKQARKRHKDKDRDRRDLEEEEERAASSRKRHRGHHHRDHGRDRHRDHGTSDRHRRHRHHSSDSSDDDEKDKEKDNSSDLEQDRGRHRNSSRQSHGRSSSRKHRDYSKGRSSSRHHHRHHHRHHSKSPSEERERSRSPSSKAKSRSPSKAPEERSRSRSRSESKRASGFDVLPTGVPSISQPGMLMTYGMQSTIMTQQATRHARRVYVGGLPPLVNEQRIAAFFNQVMENVGGNTFGPGDSVVNVYINHEKRFAFVEMRSVEEASNAMALDGIFFNGIAVRVKRPSDYDQEVAARLGPIHPSPCLNLGAVGLQYRSSYAAAAATADILTDRVYVGNIPNDWTEDDVRKLMEPFGALRSVELPKDSGNKNKGYGFVIYVDSRVTDTACNKLNQTTFGDKTLAIRRASVNGQAKPEVPSFMGPQQVVLPQNEGDIPTKVVCLTNAVSKDDLQDEEEFKEIVEDMMEECGKYGGLRKVEIPRATGGQLPENVAGLGKVFLEYKDVTSSIRAKCALDGRKFAGNTVEARYYPEHKFAAGDYSF